MSREFSPPVRLVLAALLVAIAAWLAKAWYVLALAVAVSQ